MNNIIILGCNFSGLYSAMKCVDNGLDVIIIERNSSCCEEIINYKIFNKQHTHYIQLLNRLSIKYSSYNLCFNEKLLFIINSVLQKAKHIPSKFLYMQTFDKLCYTLLSQSDYSYLKKILINMTTSIVIYRLYMEYICLTMRLIAITSFS